MAEIIDEHEQEQNDFEQIEFASKITEIGRMTIINNDDLQKQWDLEQNEIASKITEIDRIINMDEIIYIGGMCICDNKKDHSTAVVALCIVDFMTGKRVYNMSKVVKLNIPYITGYVGFREVPVYEELYRQFKIKKPEYSPNLLIVNSYGKLHPRLAGCASQLAVKLNIPVIGIGQTILNIDGLTESDVKRQFKEKCPQVGDYVELKGKSGIIYGASVKTSDSSNNPIHVTVGSYISLNTAINIIINCSTFRLPEPIRGAEKIGKDMLYEYIKKTNHNHNPDCDSNHNPDSNPDCDSNLDST